jgi:hypothetical protein
VELKTAGMVEKTIRTYKTLGIAEKTMGTLEIA